MASLYKFISATPLSVSLPNHHMPPTRRRFRLPLATLASSSPESSASSTSNSIPVNGNTLPNSYGTARGKGVDDNSPFARFFRSTESNVERIIFDFRFLALLAVGGSLAGSLLCFLNGCVYIMEAYKVYWTNCVKGIHTGPNDVYLAGTVMLIFSMGLYGLFISNSPSDVPTESDRALKASSLFGMFAMKERPKWMKISSLDELKTKVGHVIVMILLVKMFERSKMVTIATGLDLLSYSVCIFLSSASLYILHNLNRGEH
ncbi:hypothetical protein EUTSA_v10015791mg [Eutrema salsugineum]|uniref:Structural constituent of ribosome n=1 Tax=Eutrema salsugineum TaxID=72664 RepID=V4LN98_EUTSA|nr:hypothetical protein EUTSA_v10015791mg [Eutrema salsugineum]